MSILGVFLNLMRLYLSVFSIDTLLEQIPAFYSSKHLIFSNKKRVKGWEGREACVV